MMMGLHSAYFHPVRSPLSIEAGTAVCKIVEVPGVQNCRSGRAASLKRRTGSAGRDKFAPWKIVLDSASTLP